MRIVYFKKSDGEIGDVCSSTAFEKAFTKKVKVEGTEDEFEDVFDLDKLKQENLSTKFGDDADLYDIAIVPDGEQPVMGGIWDSENETMSTPPPAPELSPNDIRINELVDKFESEPDKATITELLEYLTKAGMIHRIG